MVRRFLSSQIRCLLLVTASLSGAAYAQTVSADAPFQVRYASNVSLGDSVINITNTGAIGDSLYGPGIGGGTGTICVNVYAMAPDEQLMACCSCSVTPSALVSLSVVRDLLSNTLTSVRPMSLVVKLLATQAGTGGNDSNCTNSAATSAATAVLATGLAAWGTTIRSSPATATVVTETPFTPATLSGGEFASLTNRCAFIIGNASPFGICRSCQFGGLGSVHTK